MPSNELLFLLVFAAFVFTLAGFVKGVIGLGLPTISMGLLSIVMPPAQAAALLVVPSFVTNIWQIAGPGFAALLRRLATLLAGVCAGVALGTGWLSAGHAPSWAGLALGLSLLAYASLGLLAVRLHVPARLEPWLSPLVGVSTGLVTAATGVFVIPCVPYLQALGLAKEELVRALGISFLVSTIALAASLQHGGALDMRAATSSLLALLPALLGMGLGQQLRRAVQPDTFKRIFLAGLWLLGAYLSLRALWA